VLNYVAHRKAPVPNADAVKYQEGINKLLYRELADVMNEHPKTIEQQMLKPMRQKLLPNN